MSLVAEVFWKEPNAFDVAGVAGLIVGVASIWLSWWLAKRDIDRRLEEAAERASQAARDEVRRVARALLQGVLTNTIRFLELSREAAHGRRWVRAIDRGNLAREQLTRALAQPGIAEPLAAELRDVSVALLGYLNALSSQPREGAGALAQDVQQGLDEAILTLHSIEARAAAIRLE